MRILCVDKGKSFSLVSCKYEHRHEAYTKVIKYTHHGYTHIESTRTRRILRCKCEYGTNTSKYTQYGSSTRKEYTHREDQRSVFENRSGKFGHTEEWVREKRKRWNLEDEDEYEDEDMDDDEESINMMKLVLGLLGVGVPAAFVAVPWLVNHPMSTTVVMALAPLVQSVFGFALKTWNMASKRKRYKRRYRGRRIHQQPPFELEASSSDEEDYVDESISWEINGIMESLRANGGWDELVEDRKSMVLKTPRKVRMRRFHKRDRSLFWRFILSAFPFMRSWGGFL